MEEEQKEDLDVEERELISGSRPLVFHYFLIQ